MSIYRNRNDVISPEELHAVAVVVRAYCDQAGKRGGEKDRMVELALVMAISGEDILADGDPLDREAFICLIARCMNITEQRTAALLEEYETAVRPQLLARRLH